MPAQGLSRVDGEGIYCHIYNRGVEKRAIFNDEEDYIVFLGYLDDYLTAPKDPNSTKKVFNVRGHTFQGTPHQPKNYLNKIKLVAYDLTPNQFHLILHQITKGSIESFIRSLCTRYSIYFNKKYQRTGTLFEGPYKSVQVKDEPQLLYLTRYLHRIGGHSSYLDYLGTKVTSWIKPKAVLSFFDKIKTDFPKEFHSYKDFVEKYEPGQKEKELISDLTFDRENEHLERSNLASDKEIGLDTQVEYRPWVPEFLAASAIFLLLITLGVRSIKVSEAKNQLLPALTQSEPTPAVLAETNEASPPPAEAVEPKMLTVKIGDATASVNIRQEPTISSPVIGRTKDGDTFEFVSKDAEWYEVKLADGSTGFISASVVVEEETNN